VNLPAMDQVRIGIIGLGYVGLPLAVAFGRQFPTVGFDLKQERIAELKSGRDVTLETTPEELASATRLSYTSDPAGLSACNVFVVTVPTPINAAKIPDLSPLKRASRTLGGLVKRGDIVIYESTVYPGATEEVCVPDHRGALGPEVQPGLLRRLQPGTHQPGRQGAPRREHPQGHCRLHAGGRRVRGLAVCPGHHRRHLQGLLDPCRRGRQGHREHPAGRQHRADQRAGDDLQPARHRHPGSARGRRHQVELPALPARPGRRPLHRRGPLLPDPQEPGDRLSPGDDPRRPAHQRQHGHLRRQPGGAADHPGRHGGAAAGCWCWD
jgi:hypothetical protein